MKFVVRCSVSGGYTGYNKGTYKKNGVVQFFNTEEEADRKAKELLAMVSPHAIATFKYWTEPA
jgi:hypothetical protein